MLKKKKRKVQQKKEKKKLSLKNNLKYITYK